MPTAQLHEVTPLAKNMLVDLKEFAEEMKDPFQDHDMATLQDMGIDPILCSAAYALEYTGYSGFVKKIFDAFRRTGKLTVPQQRATLNVMWGDLHGEKAYGRTHTNSGIECNECGVIHHTLKEHLEHKRDEHDFVYEYGSTEMAVLAPESVLEKQEETGYNLADIPRGCYAVPVTQAMMSDNPDQVDGFLRNKVRTQAGYVFIKVEFLKKQTFRNRRFMYGRRLTGAEYLEVGTMEVRFWESDRKELIGIQEPGKTYAGKYAFLLDYVLQNPEPCALLFSMMKDCCAVCGRSLTNANSRVNKIGDECAKQWGSIENYFNRNYIPRRAS
jgi:hypothetical protein